MLHITNPGNDDATQTQSKRQGYSSKPRRSLFRHSALQQSARVAVRGNITLFAMPLSDIVQMMKEYDAKPCELPRTGAELKEVVCILIKSGGDSAKAVIAEATVRRSIVLKVIEDGIRRGHPSYTHVNMDRVRVKASLPVEQGGLPVKRKFPRTCNLG